MTCIEVRMFSSNIPSALDCSIYSSALLNESGEFCPQKFRAEFLKACELSKKGYSSSDEDKQPTKKTFMGQPNGNEDTTAINIVGNLPNLNSSKLEEATQYDDDYDPFSDPISTVDGSISLDSSRFLSSKYNREVESSFKPVLLSESAVLPDDTHLVNTVPKDHLSQNKLVAILDLDNTLLHAYNSTKVGCNINLEDFIGANGEPEMYKFVLPQDMNTPYYLKLRPGVREFLNTIAPYYIMGICTNATREYADVIRAVLDPKRDKFGDRIVARENVDGRDTQKDFKKICIGIDTRAIVLLDDRSDVWDSSLEIQVVKAQTYEYFEHRRDALRAHYPPLTSNSASMGAAGSAPGDILSAALSSLSNASGGNTIADYDRHLDYLIKVFKELHVRFFCSPETASVGNILQTMKSEILANCVICFTGFLKADEKPTTKSLPSTWGDSQAEAEAASIRLGAKVEENLESMATHLVVQKTNTAKFHQAKNNPDIKIVHTLWLWACDGQWQRVPESLFDGEVLSDKFNQSTVSRPWNIHWEILAQKEGKAGIQAVKFRLRQEINSNVTISEYEHPAAWRQSDGARIMSPREIVTLRFS
ncbi:NLI interacting factor-like phosphatase family protein [Cryptosporidium muris RN66]|uniref:protein-serine/threonine phosphatase n=1 Tax=Cryptosporidium muris (strain RN66) TaxID=441375 RepID=B6AEZ5_CRYMR|nr:NLI interacting factor-like phosphatase family protein [Cryptosporidium muris RN66]EEA06762.1 NLI interacting factor-like phosphatase family protein [Cryptosporidium muris RN66]|eukprot:XP_002141111.1 NLI interacting factor-like phosphatase family protein [Cryptosporidium muris RN66]